MPGLTKTQGNGGTTAPATSAPEFSWEPFAAITSMRRLMDNFFDSMLAPSATLGRFEMEPPANVYEKDGTYTIECAVPGYKKDDISVEAKESEVTISGKYSEEKAEEKKQYRRRELRRGSFTRRIDFPQQIDPDHVEASLENGVLKVNVRPLKPIASKKVPITG